MIVTETLTCWSNFGTDVYINYQSSDGLGNLFMTAEKTSVGAYFISLNLDTGNENWRNLISMGTFVQASGAALTAVNTAKTKVYFLNGIREAGPLDKTLFTVFETSTGAVSGNRYL